MHRPRYLMLRYKDISFLEQLKLICGINFPTKVEKNILFAYSVRSYRYCYWQFQQFLPVNFLIHLFITCMRNPNFF